jgi:hypothetical protein
VCGASGADELDVRLTAPPLKAAIIVVPRPQPVGQHGAADRDHRTADGRR